MISRISGRLVRVTEELQIEVEAGGLWYELLAPRSALPDLAAQLGHEVTLFTVHYLEGNPAGNTLLPRLLGFLHVADREFFHEFTRVKGIGMRKAMRAMAVPSHQIAAAIESADERALAALPEIGKKLAATIVAELRGRLTRFLAADPGGGPQPQLNDAQRLAADILVQWGDRRADAMRLVSAAVESEPELREPEAIVRAAYRIKQRAG